MSEEIMRAIGQLEGKVDIMIANQDATSEKIDKIDTRLRKVETKAAVHGAAAGGVAGIGMALIVAKIRATFGV